jgi:hypothetical protein
MYRITEVKALPEFHVWLKYSDGIAGEVDLSHLAGKGVFKKWDIAGEFERVTIGASGELMWGNEIDLCPDALYLKITGRRPEELFPALTKE